MSMFSDLTKQCLSEDIQKEINKYKNQLLENSEYSELSMEYINGVINGLELAKEIIEK